MLSTQTLSKLMTFQNSLKASKATASSSSSSSSSSASSYHGQILDRESDNEEEMKTMREEWHVGPLKFTRHIDDAYRGGDGRATDSYDVIDPLSLLSSSSSKSSYSSKSSST